MADASLVCQCTKEREINELREEVKRLRENQYTDHDLLVRLDVKMGTMADSLETLIKKVDALVIQPSDRFEKLKVAGITAIVVFGINYIATFLFKG